MSRTMLSALLLSLAAASGCMTPGPDAGGGGATTTTGDLEALAMLAHDVYFTLEDPTPENTDALVAGCHEYLKDHPGVVFFAAGTLAEGLDREVNDLDFHVALHVVFDTRESHDAYQVAPRHKEFIEKLGDLWASVRVFDSSVR